MNVAEECLLANNLPRCVVVVVRWISLLFQEIKRKVTQYELPLGISYTQLLTLILAISEEEVIVSMGEK